KSIVKFNFKFKHTHTHTHTQDDNRPSASCIPFCFILSVSFMLAFFKQGFQATADLLDLHFTRARACIMSQFSWVTMGLRSIQYQYIQYIDKRFHNNKQWAWWMLLLHKRKRVAQKKRAAALKPVASKLADLASRVEPFFCLSLSL